MAKTSVSFAGAVQSANWLRNAPVQRWYRPCLEWLPCVLLRLFAWFGSAGLVPWSRMWLLAGAILAGCKWLTWRRAPAMTKVVPIRRSLGYLLTWPGMDAEAFLDTKVHPPAPSRAAWVQAVAKTLFGAILVW